MALASRSLFEKLIEFNDGPILEGKTYVRTATQNIGRKVSKTINFRHVPRKDYEGIRVRRGVDRDADGDFFDHSFDDLRHVEIDEAYWISCSPPRSSVGSRQPPVLYFLVRVSRLIRAAVAGLTSLAVAVGFLLCLVLWHDKR